jgi:hypothetical protein
MIGRSPALARRRRSSSTRATAAASIRDGISPGGAVSCKPMPMPGSASYMPASAVPRRSSKRHAGAMVTDLRKGPLTIEAVRRIDAIFAIEREINGAAACFLDDGRICL